MNEHIDLPSEISLRPSLWKWIGVCSIGTVFTAIGIFMIVSEPSLMAWGCTLFFGLVAGVGLLQIFYSSLKLDLDGFEETKLGRKIKRRWVEVSQFGVWSVSGNNLVCYDRAMDSGKMAGVNRAIAGASQSLGDTYSLSAPELALLMNRFRTRALSELAEKFEESPLSQDAN